MTASGKRPDVLLVPGCRPRGPSGDEQFSTSRISPRREMQREFHRSGRRGRYASTGGFGRSTEGRGSGSDRVHLRGGGGTCGCLHWTRTQGAGHGRVLVRRDVRRAELAQYAKRKYPHINV